MEYLESLSIPELVSYLKGQYRSANFKVEQILVAREEKIMKNAADSAKELEMCKTKLSDLPMEREEKKHDVEVEDTLGKLDFDNIGTEIQLQKYKGFCDELKEKVARLEEDLEMHRAKCSELMTALDDKRKESIIFEDKLGKCEGEKIASENELKEYKMICEELKGKVAHVEEYSKKATERINFLAKDLRCTRLNVLNC